MTHRIKGARDFIRDRNAATRASECHQYMTAIWSSTLGHSLSLPRSALSVLAFGERADTPAKGYTAVLRFDRDLVGIALCMTPE